MKNIEQTKELIDPSRQSPSSRGMRILDKLQDANTISVDLHGRASPRGI